MGVEAAGAVRAGSLRATITGLAGAVLTTGLAVGAVRDGAGSGLGSGATTGSGDGTGSSANADGAAIAVASASRHTSVASHVRARRVGVIEAASIVVEPPFGAAGRVTLARPGADDNYLFGQDSARPHDGPSRHTCAVADLVTQLVFRTVSSAQRLSQYRQSS